VWLWRLYLDGPPLWILDEPFTALDKQGVANWKNAWRSTEQGGLVVLTTHHSLSACPPVTRPGPGTVVGMSVFGLLSPVKRVCCSAARLSWPIRCIFRHRHRAVPAGGRPETQLLQTLSPGLVWVAALLSVLLSLDGLFRSDFEDGSLEQWVLSPHPLPLLVLARCWHTGRFPVWRWSCFRRCWR
jgi:hypothetical protein